MIVLLLSFLPILIFGLLPTIWSVATLGTISAIIAFTLIGITFGHFLGGPDPNDRTALALATSTRHPGIAIALAVSNIAEAEAVRAVAVVLLYLLVSGIVATPYLNWLSTSKTQEQKVPKEKVA
jgi:BASS family bile acid:Na+ symporter